MAFTAKVTVTEDGNSALAFRGEPVVLVQLPLAERKVEAHNVPSYKLAVSESLPGIEAVRIKGANVKALDAKKDAERTASRKITFRCPGPLLDRLTRHVAGPPSIGLAALAEFGLNVLLSSGLRLDVSGSVYINAESLLLTAKRAIRDGEPLPPVTKSDGKKAPAKKAAKKP